VAGHSPLCKHRQMQQSHAAAWPRYTAVHYMQIALWPSLWSRLVHEVQDQNEMGQASSKLLTAMHMKKKLRLYSRRSFGHAQSI